MPKITFSRDELYESEGRNKGPAFAAGETIVCTDGFAERWVRRGAAEVVGKGEPKGEAAFERLAAAAPEPAPEGVPAPPPAAAPASAAAKTAGKA